MDSSAKSQLVERLKTASTVLVTVSSNPSVDQLAACIGLTLIVNKLNKHGTAVFSGEIPSTIEFLKPEDTLEKTTDSLQDFIIALDKNKADRLRYKVEDQMVRIFITPYRSSLSEADLEFGLGDFNVELIIALGAQSQEDLDQAIVAHGRILHDATVTSINTVNESTLGSINWNDPQASSLSELVADLSSSLDQQVLDEQIATALLTGIVAETNRFSNEKTSSQTMNISAQLMAAGANQQLVATELAEPLKPSDPDQESSDSSDDQSNGENGDNDSEGTNTDNDEGALNIDHNDESVGDTKLPEPQEVDDADAAGEEEEESDSGTTEPTSTASSDEPTSPVELQADQLADDGSSTDQSEQYLPPTPKFVSDPPEMGGTLTANSQPDLENDPSIDPLSNVVMPPVPEDITPSDADAEGTDPTSSLPTNEEVVTPPSAQPSEQLLTGFTPPPPTWVPPFDDKQLQNDVSQDSAESSSTLSDLEKAVDSPHLNQPDVNDARGQVDAVLAQVESDTPEPDKALNSFPLGEPLHPPANVDNANVPADQSASTSQDGPKYGVDPSMFTEPEAEGSSPSSGAPSPDSTPPPLVPPPITMPFNPTNPGDAPASS